MLLTQDQEMVRDAVRVFAREELWPNAARWDKEHHFPKEAHKGLAALGAYGICVPEEYGGANLDYLTLALVLEEIAAGDGGTSTAISVTNCPVNAILMRYGTPAVGEAPDRNQNGGSKQEPRMPTIITLKKASRRGVCTAQGVGRCIPGERTDGQQVGEHQCRGHHLRGRQRRDSGFEFEQPRAHPRCRPAPIPRRHQ